jgi:cysteine synthase A
MLPDTGERYLSTPLFEGIGVDMNDEELALSRSTPGNRFDAPAPQPAAAVPAPVVAPRPEPVAPVVDAGAESYVAQVIADNAVVMFSLEWCEFCWAVRKLLARMDIAFESVDLDSVALQQRDLGTQIRAVLKARTGSPTIPQIWIAGTHVGWRDRPVRGGARRPDAAAAGPGRRHGRAGPGHRPDPVPAQVAASAQGRRERRRTAT